MVSVLDCLGLFMRVSDPQDSYEMVSHSLRVWQLDYSTPKRKRQSLFARKRTFYSTTSSADSFTNSLHCAY